jgi:hypothetical protein
VLTRSQVLDVGSSAPRIVIPDEEGHLRLALVRGARGVGAPSTPCGWTLGRREVSVSIPRAILPPRPVIRIGYLASSATTLTMTANGRSSRIPIAEGPGTAFVQVSGADLSSLAFSASDDGATVCTDDITVGTPVPIPGSTP